MPPGFSLHPCNQHLGGLACTRRSTRDVRVRRPGVRPAARRFARGTDVPGGFTVRSVGSTGCSTAIHTPLAAGDREPAPRCWSCASRRSPASTAKGWLRQCDTRTAIPGSIGVRRSRSIRGEHPRSSGLGSSHPEAQKAANRAIKPPTFIDAEFHRVLQAQRFEWLPGDQLVRPRYSPCPC